MWTGLKSLLLFFAMLGICLAPKLDLQAAEQARSKSTQSASANRQASTKTTKTKKATPPRRATPAKKQRKAAPVKRAMSSDQPAQDPSKLAVQSGSALVVEQGGGEALFQKNADNVMPIASITKLMTAMVVLDSMPDLRAELTISDSDIDYLRGSRSRLPVGTSLTRETALLLALMSSESRAANALARHYPGGIPAFVANMNLKAESLGLTKTRFDDPTGLSSGNVSTAHDLARMVAAAHRYPLIREWTTTPEATVEVNHHELEFRNTNPLVKSPAWEVGLSKTGYIHEAGKCLVMQARVAEKPVLIVLLDSAGKQTRVGDANRIKRWMENLHAARKQPTHAAIPARSSQLPG